MANWSQEAVKALAEAVSERRRRLGRSQIEVWQNGGPSNSTMTSIESAASTSVTPMTLRKLDAGLSWLPDTAAKVLRGEVLPYNAVRHIGFDARGANEIANDPAVLQDSADHAQAQRDRVLAATSAALGDFAALIAALSVDADDIASSARSLDTAVDVGDEDEVERFVSDVEDVVSDIEDFVASVNVVARKVFGGDLERLRRMKRETKRLRRQQAPPVVAGLSQSDFDLAGKRRETDPKVDEE